MAARRVFVPTLRKGHRARIEKALARSKDPKYRDKCRAVLWSSEGWATGEIARMLRIHYTTVYRWICDYLRFRFRGLKVGRSPGRPPSIDTEGEAVLCGAVDRNPKDLGYPFTRWTLQTLSEHLYRACHVRVSLDTVRRHLRRLRYRYKRPKLSLKHRQNRRQVRRARRARDHALKKGLWTRTGTPSSTWTSASFTSIPA